MRLYLILTTIFLCIYFNINAQQNKEERTQKITQTIKVFPNPATNVVNILGLHNSSNANIKVLDTYGNIVLKHSWQIKNNAINIPVSSLASGVYIIIIHSNKEQVQAKIFKK
ncbi:putative secreted protein (Por secretion system target) [Maribacter vaceletii]|uniref:Putative secreted protein (Por secretion system target) n=1 Tax=Maribacter vaceletii TaxID=1206816 RepID=A0A495EC08_9FLAO|nr:T9SS type A sorting domain-containing protein [Maribacter vaceletii]RKR14149.1 putative secreted protein (Por secretion system target) [Maribacter vaceletii]